MRIAICQDALALGAAAAAQGAAVIRDAVARSGAANIVLATGASQFTMLEVGDISQRCAKGGWVK